jgi:hypothetical protein
MKFREAVKESVNHLGSSDFYNRIKEEDERMLSEIDILTKINKKGLLSFDSQSGRQQKGKHYNDKKPYTIDERAYIAGFMLKKEAVSFLRNMNLHTDKMALAIPVSTCDIDIPSDLDIPLTLTKHAGKEIVETHMSLAIPESYMDFQRKQSKINKTEDVLYIFCFDPKWNRYSSDKNGLFTDILNTLANLK